MLQLPRTIKEYVADEVYQSIAVNLQQVSFYNMYEGGFYPFGKKNYFIRREITDRIRLVLQSDFQSHYKNVPVWNTTNKTRKTRWEY